MKNWSGMHSFGLALAVMLLPALAWWSMSTHHPVWGWLAAMFLIGGFSLLAGHGVLGVWRGALIDDRNVISLSRFQMFLWTVIVLSAFFTAAFCNLYAGIDPPLAIQVPNTLWILMGISTTSLVGAPLILSQKKSKPPTASFDETRKMLVEQGEKDADITHKGRLIGTAKPELAKWSDMFTGDETSNGAHLDLAKLQMFFFTMITALAYAASLLQVFRYSQAGGVASLPELDQSLLALIGISHSGYLINKATPRD